MPQNIVQEKSFSFSLRIIKLYQLLKNEQKEFIISKQILRSGTSIGANIEEGIGGQSKKDFIAKLSISYKEARETHYWLRLLQASKLLDYKLASSMLLDCEELIKLLTSIINSAKRNT